MLLLALISALDTCNYKYTRYIVSVMHVCQGVYIDVQLKKSSPTTHCKSSEESVLDALSESRYGCWTGGMMVRQLHHRKTRYQVVRCAASAARFELSPIRQPMHAGSVHIKLCLKRLLNNKHLPDSMSLQLSRTMRLGMAVLRLAKINPQLQHPQLQHPYNILSTSLRVKLTYTVPMTETHAKTGFWTRG